MATLLRPLLRPGTLTVGLGLGLSCSFVAANASLSRFLNKSSFTLRCDSPRGFGDYENKARQAASSSARKSGIDARVVRQITAGSIIGLLGGLAISTFSKPLTLLIGILVLGAQALESRGIHIIPYGRLQRLFRNVDVKRLASENVAFKSTFGLMFALAAFAEF